MASKWCTRSCLFSALLVILGIANTSTFAADVESVAPGKPAQQLPDASGQVVKWALRKPKEAGISYRGTASFDNVGTQGSAMMYPAPNVAGLLAAILTHAAISEASKDSEKNKLQAQADKVLDAYRGILDGFSSQSLMQAAIGMMGKGIAVRLIDESEKADGDWVVEVAPVFFLTQDQSALILDNAIVIFPPGASGNEKSQRSVRVVSSPIDEKNASTYWLASEGAKLKQQSASLLAQSLIIGLDQATASLADGEGFRTIRYPEGKAEKIERAQIVREQCERLVIRSLRGTLMSIPVTSHSGASEKAASCHG